MQSESKSIFEWLNIQFVEKSWNVFLKDFKRILIRTICTDEFWTWFSIIIFQVIEAQKVAYFRENPMGSADSTPEIDDEDDERCYQSPQIFLRQLFKLYRKGLIDDKNIRDQVYLMVNDFKFYSHSFRLSGWFPSSFYSDERTKFLEILTKRSKIQSIFLIDQ